MKLANDKKLIVIIYPHGFFKRDELVCVDLKKMFPVTISSWEHNFFVVTDYEEVPE